MTYMTHSETHKKINVETFLNQRISIGDHRTTVHDFVNKSFKKRTVKSPFLLSRLWLKIKFYEPTTTDVDVPPRYTEISFHSPPVCLTYTNQYLFVYFLLHLVPCVT